MRHLIFRLLSPLLVLSAPAALADPVALCQQATPEFPQACACVVEKSRAAGFDGALLDKLVSNQVDGVPIETFSAYGQIFASCIQSAVMATVPGGAPAAPTAPTAPATADPAPATADPAPETATADVAAPLGLVPAGPERAAGQWGNIVYDFGGTQLLMTGTAGPDGSVLAMACPTDGQPAPGGTPVLLAGPVPAEGTVLPGRLEVLGSAGRLQFQDLQFERVHDRYLTVPVLGQMTQAMQRGNSVRVTIPSRGVELTFGLSGSGRALGDMLCVRIPRPGMGMVPELTYNGEWTVTGATVAGPLSTNVAASTDGFPHRARVRVSCDRRLILPIPNLGGRPVGVTLDGDMGPETELASTPIGSATYESWTDPLPEALLARMRDAHEIRVAGPLDGDPGETWEYKVTLDGFGAALDALDCPGPPPERTAQPKIDLTGSGVAWAPVDLSPLAGGQRWDAAMFEAPDAPVLLMGCDRVPFFQAGAFDMQTDATVRFVVDGNPATEVTATYGFWRAFRQGGSRAPDIAPHVAGGRTLRVEVIENPAVDVLYPLEGLAGALAAAGCSAN